MSNAPLLPTTLSPHNHSLAHGSKSPVAGMKALALFAALGAVKLARSADTGVCALDAAV